MVEIEEQVIFPHIDCAWCYTYSYITADVDQNTVKTQSGKAES